MFMKPEIEHGAWHICETDTGTCIVPADLCAGNSADVLMYCDATVVYEVETKEGYGARFSAPGYMDCTDWAFFEQLDEACEFLFEWTDEDDAEEVLEYLSTYWDWVPKEVK